MAGGTLFATRYQEAHLVVTNPAETCGVFVCPFECYQEGGQHGFIEASAVVDAHHLDFNMIEHCHSLCCLGAEQALGTVIGSRDDGYRMTTIGQLCLKRGGGKRNNCVRYQRFSARGRRDFTAIWPSLPGFVAWRRGKALLWCP